MNDLTWEDFEHRLASSLAKMAVDQYLIVSTPADDERASPYYVQFAQGGRAGCRAEAVSNQYLAGPEQLSPTQEELVADLGWQFPDPHASKPENYNRQWPLPAPFPDLARLAVRTLREVYGIGSPAELVYRRFARGGPDIPEPTLGIPTARPSTPRVKRQAKAPKAPKAPAALEGLVPLLEGAIPDFVGQDSISVDRAGNYTVRMGANDVLLRILASEPPVVRVFAPIFRGVVVTPDVLAAINDANAELTFCRVLVVNNEVIVSTELRTAGLTPDDVSWGCVVVDGCAKHVQAQLTSRIPALARLEDSRSDPLPN